jgi:hypothetical protein
MGSPLWDVRSLGGSTLVHGLVLFLASSAVITIALPRERDEARTIEGQVGPTDNRAATFAGAGGAPGPSGRGTASDPNDPSRLLDEALSPRASTDLPRWLRPRTERGSGAAAGSGSGGDGGLGGGTGGGQGTGVGPGTEFFGTRETAKQIVYVIDRSGSMIHRNSLGIAKRELLNSMDELSEECSFAVIFYDTHAVFADAPKLEAATSEHRARLHTKLESIGPDGGTDHKVALMAAFKLKPEVIFFLTDADQMTDLDADELLAAAGKVRIHATEFGVGPAVISSAPLKRLATSSGGRYRYIDVTTFH